MHSLVIFASGAGSNAAAIIAWFKANGKAKISLIVCNKPGAGVLQIAAREGIPVLMVEKGSFSNPGAVARISECDPSLIVLAGYLWKVPDVLVRMYPTSIINIHPALLPAYGGKGMYGSHVHEAVVAAGEKESGITIHYVNEEYDKGGIIMQAHCPVLPVDTPADLAGRIHSLEHFYYPRTIEYLLDNRE